MPGKCWNFKKNKVPGDNLKLADYFAADYDSSITDETWIGPHVIHLMLNSLLQAKSKILDLGIGTGASSKPLKKEGHIITGIDGSEKMLEVCKSKNIAEELILQDLEITPFPLTDNLFDAIISNGVFHLVHPILPVIEEAKRLLIPGGYFVFTFEKESDLEESNEIEPGIWEKKTKTGVLTYKHSTGYIFSKLRENNFDPLLQTEFLGYVNKELEKEFYFIAIAAKLT